MQINSIGNTNFGLKFSDNMYELLNDGRQHVAQRNSKSLRPWACTKKAIKDMYDKRYTLDVQFFNDGKKTIVVKDKNADIYPVMTLWEDEVLDRPYIINLKNKLEDMASIFSKKQ